ncbi:Hydroxamate-type ferrichrome siderophore peptide synthetase [Colletotrichum gloeosporioides]|uniref:Hydroxamate-type ferrichrome siderophore peptide synthetase n=1 Tax=Colletotrichum gloeosporioides TaxID=474922 RepID=A0A8H4C5B3_COLGL|nr:Hydroxamate-type ferrichrome siderophore peptide synthetase [Colletotrichum gloeosporioides]KAF3797679.1 Hydroxamate-type ferrichrome siderophore peptide synthetase [Colletotrichum gloeosporioides]
MNDSEPEPELKLSILNPHPQRVPGPHLLHELVHFSSDDSIPAIHSLDAQGRESTWSYSQLHRSADVLAARISAVAKIRPKDEEFVVPLLVPQCPQLYISMLAILKAGGAFCPLNLDAPPERVRFILQDVAAKVVIVSRELATKIPQDDQERTILIVDEDAVEDSPVPKISESETIPQRLAYVMYTSGSTGTPKGVGVSHEAATQSLLAHNKHIPSFRRFLQFASPTFDVSVFEIFFPLFRGCTLVTCDRGRMLNDLPDVIRTLQVDACELTPTVAGSLLRLRQNAPGLRLLLTIGEMLTEAVVNEFGGSEEAESILWGMYGPTEAAIHCTLRPEYPTTCPASNIGFPLKSVSCFVAAIPDEGTPYEFRILPLGETGELVVGGHQLANGYLNRPEQTSAAFLDTPFGRVYRTGDKAKMNPDGTLECLGRISDGQVKLRGQRIELGEVEQAAMRASGCHSAVAMVLAGILVVFCAMDDDANSNDHVEDILATCAKWLPSFMVPGDVILMTSFPRLPSGKVDRKLLKSDYEVAKISPPTSSSELTDPLLREVATAISDLLGFEVSPSTQLGSSGVDSLMTIRLASALREKGFNVSATDVLESRDVSSLCSRLAASSDSTGDASAKYSEIPINQVLEQHRDLDSIQSDIEAVHWCTPLQNAMLAETAVNSQAYCNWIELEIPTGSTTHDAEKWIRDVASVNSIFRSGFIPLGRGFAQVVFHRLSESSVTHVEQLDRSFSISSDREFLRPLRVQICQSDSDDGGSILLQIHHALYDGWSADMLLEDLSALAQGKPIKSHPQFQDVANFFSDPTTTRQLDDARSFWAENLLGWQRHSLPRLMGRLPETIEVLTTRRTLDISQVDLDEGAKQLQCHPQVFFQAALSWLWAGLQGQPDVVIGSVSSGRTIPVTNVEHIMGPCISSTPLRVDLRGLSSIADLIRAIHATNRQVLQHGILPLNEIKKLTGLSPGDSIYDVLFVYQESLYSQNRTTGQVREVAHQDFLETGLLVEVEPTANGPSCRITHHTNAISREHASLLVHQLESVVLHLLRNPKSHINTISNNSSPDLRSIFNDAPSTLNDVPDLASIFERAADLTPDAIAVRFATLLEDDAVETVSYSELNASANKIAHCLQDCGAKEGGIVGLVMEKSIPLYAAMLGILKAGCAYLPLLPSSPAERVRGILTQADVTVCVADSEVSAALTEVTNCHFIDVRRTDMSIISSDNLSIPPNPSRPAYVIYTSGTTGKPKGVVVTQLNIAGNLDVLSRIYPHAPTSRLLQACSQAFDVSVFEIFFTWKVGACLCSGTNDTLFEDLERAIRFFGCTHLSMTPTVASLVDPRNVPGVEFLVTAGEPMTTVVAKKWTGHLYQGYGPAETTNICTVKKMKPGDFIDHLGFSFENTSTIVLSSESLDPLPIAFAGELCFGGDQVAAGYLGMPELTNSKFVNHPQLGRIYRSGDMGRMLPDGSLMVLGRMDDQLKLRGQRIDTGEISSILTTSGLATSSAAVIVSRNNSPATQLAVFYVPTDNGNSEHMMLPIDDRLAKANRTLFGLLRSQLPTYMVPTYLFPISSIPLTSSGKIDRAAMQASFREFSREHLDLAAGSNEEHDDENAWSDQEKTIALVLSQDLSIPLEDITRWQPFAAVGLDSISAISLARALRGSFSAKIPVSLILRCGSVARLAQEISTQQTEDETQSMNASASMFPDEYVEAIKEDFAKEGQEVSTVLPCTPLQEAMLSSTAGSSYSNQLIFKLRIPESDMKGYWEEMCQRHTILRTCFITTTESRRAVAQVVLSSWTMPWHNIEAESLRDGAENHTRNLSSCLNSKIPPVSLAVIKSESLSHLSFVCHHALYDGVAIDVLLTEIEQLASGKPLQPPVDYLPVLHEIIGSPDGSNSFWKTQFDGFKSAQHQLSVRSAETIERQGPLVVTNLLETSLSDLQSVSKATGVSTLSFFQTVWSVFLSIVYNETDVCFGNVMSGRALSHEGIDRLVAPCFNTLPIRIELPASAQFVTMLRKFQNLNPRLLERQFTPLRSVQNQVTKSGMQLFDSLLLMQQPRSERDASVWEVVEDNGAMDVPLVCEITPEPRSDSISIKLHCNSELMTTEALTSLLRVFLHLVAKAAKHPASSVPSRENLPIDIQELLESIVVDKTVDEDEPESEQSQNVSEDKEWNDSEKQIRSVLAKLSKTSVSQISRHTSIFQLGLDSINAVQLAAMLRDQGLQLSALDVIGFPTCAKMAARLGQSAKQDVTLYDFAKFEREIGNISLDDGIEKVLPCTPLQCAMLSNFIQSGGKDYLNYMSFALNDDVSLDKARAAWESLFEHHQMLRTGFLPTQHRNASFAMLQYSARGTSLPLAVHDNETESFNVTKWKLDIAHAVLQTLENPPWAVALDCLDSGINMHIFMHHALYDAFSLQLILRDLAILLQGGRPSQHPPIDRALSNIMAGSAKEDSEEFWKKKSSEVVVNRFPTLTPLSEASPELTSSSKSASISLEILTEKARQADVSIQTILEAAWTRVLSAYLGEEDVVFGVVLSGRIDDETEGLVFPCINTVPVIAHNKSSNSELLQQMLGYHNELLKHQNTPLAQIQRWLGHQNAQVFDTLLVYQRIPEDGALDFPWKTVSDEGNLDYPLSLEIEPLAGGEIQLRVTHRTDVLPAVQARHLVDQFDAILQHLAQNPTGTEDDLWVHNPSVFSILPPQEPDIPSEEQFLHQFVESKARTHPDKVALEFVTGFHGETPISKQWSFKELNEKGNQVANLLSQHSKVGHTIAIHFDKCPEACFSILGILKSGCAFLALDPSAPKARKEFILKDSGALALLTNNDIDFVVDQPIHHIEDSVLDTASKEFSSPDSLSIQDNSYCLYTSGTTGTPKGCEITHENAVQAMKAFQRLFEGHWDETSKWLQFASFHFDVSVLEQYWSWSVGMTLVGAPRDLILDDLAGTIRNLAITHIDLTPSLARLLDPAEVPSLSRGVFITGGEALKQEILDVWGPVGVIYNAYGPTEATIGVTMYQRVPHNGRASNIGKQFDNVGSYVLKPGTDIPVMKGAVGELCVSGKLVGKGYLNRPELTQERFPVLKGFNERVYRTGDLVRLLHDGCFDFLGRADDQVKLRGQRLEIGEINHSIRTRVSEVSDVATLVTKHGSLDKDMLVSFVSHKSTANSKAELQVLNEPTTAALVRSVQKACRDTLPGYMVPSYIFQVPRIPLSPNNKADIKQLNQLFRTLTPETLVQLSPSSRTTSEPTNEVQRQIVSTVQEFLGDDTPVSLSCNIFDLGVDSISALRLSRLMRKNGLSGAAPRVILRNPTLGDLAEVLQQTNSASEGSGVHEARQLIQAFGHRYRSLAVQELSLPSDGDIEYVAPCTPLQEGMLSRFMSDQDEGAYFTAFRLKLSSEISIERLRVACEQLVKSHAILRTSFIQTPAGFAQVALKSSELSWRDLRVLEPAEVETQLASAMPALIHKNSRCVSDPLELIVARVGEETILVVHIFHALYDGVTFETMLRWVSDEYSQKEHQPAPSFLDTLAHGPLANYDSSRQFWTEHLSNCLFDTIPRLQGGDPSSIITRTKTYSARNLETLRRSLNVTLQSVVLALWTSVFKKHFPINAATGVIVSGRSIDMDQIENTIGPLFNTLLFYAGLKEGDTWLSLIQKCHEFSTAVLQFQHVPLRNIQKWCTKSRGRPSFENLFVFQVEQARSAEPSGMWSIMDDYSVSDNPLAFEASSTPDGQLRVQIVAHGDVADEAMMNSLFEEIDEAMVDVTSRATYSLPVSANVSRDASTAASPRTPLTSRPESIDGDFKDHELNLNISDFEWTPAALVLRKEIAALSGASEESIIENMALLELGLDSIDLVKLSARLKHSGHNLTLSQLMKSQTIAVMSSIINRNKPVSEDSNQQSNYDDLKAKLWEAVESTNFEMQQVEAVLPPTPLQESMIADMLQSDFEQYFNHDVLELASGADVDKFEQAWQQVVQRSPILRTVFVQIEDPSVDQTFAQVISKSSHVLVNKLQTGDVTEVQSIVDKHKRNAREAQGHSNLLQLSVIPGDNKSLVVLSISHALYDGWSLALLHQDVAAAYQGQLSDRPQTEQFLQSLVQTPTDQSRKFWSQYLANTRPSLLSERQLSATSPGDHTYRTEAVSSTGLDRVTDFCKRHAVSLQVLGQACWASTLATLLQTLEVSFGVVLAGRDSEPAQALMFPTMNTVAVRCVLHGSATNFLRYLQETMGDIVEFQNYPLRKAQAIAGGRLFNTLFILQKNPESGPENPLMKSVQGSSATEFAVCAELEATSKNLIWRIAGQNAALQYIISNPEENLLRFEDDNVSICQLPSFQARKAPADSSTKITKSDEATEWTGTEKLLRRVLSQAAGVEESSISKSHTLYNLGLDSISAIKVSALLRKEGLNLGVKALLTSTSIQSMAQQAQSSTSTEMQQSPDTPSAGFELPSTIDSEALLTSAGIAESQVLAILPPLPMQVYMMSAWQNSEGRVFYPEFSYRVQGSVTVDQLQGAWSAVVESEPILRTCLVATGQRSLPFVQIVLRPDADGPHKHIAMQGEAPTPESHTESCWPQVHLSAKQEDDKSWLLQLKLQHSLYDGFSLPALMQHLLSTIQGQDSKKVMELDLWRSFLGAHHHHEVKDDNRKFWTEYFEGIIPATSSKLDDTTKSLERVALLQRSAISGIANLQGSCSQAGVGLPALFFAAAAKTLQKSKILSSSLNTKEVIFGIYYANRSLADNLQPTFPTLNLVPLKVRVDETSSIITIAQRVQQDLHLISSHSTVGLWEIKDWTGLEIDCFVNFLHLGDDDKEILQAGDVSFELVSNGDEIEGLTKTDGNSGLSSSVSARWLVDNAVRDAFPDAVDIEASIKEGAMDIGVFGSAAKVSQSSAGELISVLSCILKEL